MELAGFRSGISVHYVMTYFVYRLGWICRARKLIRRSAAEMVHDDR